jgi:hypothetical protein
VSKFGLTTTLKSAAGNSRMWLKVFTGPRPGILPGSMFVVCFRVTSIVSSGYR